MEKNSNNLKILDGIRGLSALYVMVHHARLGLTQSFQIGLSLHPEKYTVIEKLTVYFLGLFKYGHEAVIVFFVLSGFVIHLKQAASDYNVVHFKTVNYLKKRIIRIYPTLLTAFILGFVIDIIVHILTGETIRSLFQKYQISDFFNNILLIPDTPVFGINYPIWSLKHEWFFYLIYPALLWGASKHKLIPLGLVGGLYVSYCIGIKFPLLGASAYTLSTWLIGCILAFCYKKHLFFKEITFLMTFIVIYIFMPREDVNFYPYLDVMFGLITAGGIAFLISKPQCLISKVIAKLTGFGTFSYTLYLMHTPLIYGMQKIIFSFKGTYTPYHPWFVILACFIIPPISYLIYYFSERLAIQYKKGI